MNYEKIIEEFSKQYKHLKMFGLVVHGIANLDYDNNINVISVSTPFIFDRTKLPDKFMGFGIREGIQSLPDEFKNINKDKEYIWAYQRFEEYVDKNADFIKITLNSPNITRTEILDALCFGNFKKHKEDCIKWENEGEIPPHISSQS